MDRADHDVITIAGADIKEMKDKTCMFSSESQRCVQVNNFIS